MTDTPEVALTDDEHLLVNKLGECFTLFTTIVRDDKTRHPDLAEICHHIHILQHTVMAQAAARIFPSRYRLLGELVHKDSSKETP